MQGRGDVISMSRLAEALSLILNVASACVLWLEGLGLVSSLSLLWLKSLLCSPPISYSCPLPFPSLSSFNDSPLAFSRKLFVPCKRNIHFYITSPMRLWKSLLFFSCWCGLSVAFRKRWALGPMRFPVWSDGALDLDLFSGKPHTAAGLLN